MIAHPIDVKRYEELKKEGSEKYVSYSIRYWK